MLLVRETWESPKLKEKELKIISSENKIQWQEIWRGCVVKTLYNKNITR